MYTIVLDTLTGNGHGISNFSILICPNDVQALLIQNSKQREREREREKKRKKKKNALVHDSGSE